MAHKDDRLWPICFAALAIIFAIDTVVPNGIAVAAAYVLPVAVTLFLKDIRSTFLVYAASGALTMLGMWIPEGSAPEGTTVANRLLSLLSVGVATLLIVRSKRFAERFFLGVEASPTATLLLDGAGRIVLANARTEALFGYRRDALAGRPVETLLPPSFRDTYTSYLAPRRDAPPTSVGGELRGLKADGTEFSMEMTLNPVSSHSEVTSLVTLTDTSERQLAHGRFRRLVESAPTAMVALNSEGRIALVNATAERLFGYRRDELLGRPMALLVHEARARSEPAVEWGRPDASWAGGVAGSRDLRGRRKDGTEFPVEVGLNPIELPEGAVVLLLVHDVSERREWEERLSAYNRQLRQTNEELDAFAHVVSHDLKAPLRAIDNLSKWIVEDADAHLPDRSRRHLEQMRQRVRRLEALLDDMLEYARAGRSRGEVEEVDVDAVLRDTVQLIQPPPEFEIVAATQLPRLRTDRVCLAMVLRNLVQNAVKHHDRRDGKVSVSARDAGDTWEFEVRDDGPGIPAEFHGTIFQMFQKLRPRDEVEGSGLGLAIVKKTVEKLGGTVTLESAPGLGASFRFRWPKEPEAHVAVPI